MKLIPDLSVNNSFIKSWSHAQAANTRSKRITGSHLPMLVLMLISVLSTSSCKPQPQPSKPLLLASIHPYELILKQLAGSEFEVKSIIPAGASPHTWSPGPSDLHAFASAEFILSNGFGLETNLAKNFASRAQVHVEVAALLKDVLPIPKTDNGENPEGVIDTEHQHTGPDPHLWTSPFLMLRLCTKLEKELSNRFPNSSLVFARNAALLRQELEALISKIQLERQSYQNPGIITYHNSFMHFCQDFKIETLGWVQASPGKEPTPKELSELGKTIQANGVKAIFVEPQMDKKAGEVLAKEFGLKLLMLDPLGSDNKAHCIAELINNNWNSMREGFGA